VGLVSSSLPGYTADVETYDYDLDAAAEELAQSSYADTISDYTIDLYWCSSVAEQETIALVIQAAAAQVGLNINIVECSWAQFTDMVADPSTTPALSFVSNMADYPEAGSILYSRFHSSTCGTWTQTEWLQDETVDSLLDSALATLDTASRMEKYGEVQKYLSEIVPSVGLYQGSSTIAYNAGRLHWEVASRCADGETTVFIPGDEYDIYDMTLLS
jgi:peptide/nickel transport system substrate-binding protein